MILVAFGHRQQVGKDTCAKYLSTILKTETNGLAIKTVGFADKLKDISYELYAWAGMKPRDYYEEHPKEKEVVLPLIGKSPRQIWIELGNKMREIYEPTWIAYVVHGFANKVDVLLVKDLRYPNEMAMARESGAKIVKVERASQPYVPDQADRALRDAPDSAWDTIVNNDGSLNDCYDLVYNQLWLPLVKPLIPQSKIKVATPQKPRA